MTNRYLQADAIVRALGYQSQYDGKQYDGLLPWENERDPDGNYITIKRRKPGVRNNLSQSICNRVAAFMTGAGTFPTLKFKDPEQESIQESLDWLRDEVLMKVVPNAVLSACIQGSVAITFGLRRGKLLVWKYARSQSWPIFDDADELAGLVVLHRGEHRETGKTVWFRMVLTAMEETWEYADRLEDDWQLYDGPVRHGFGFVPAVWVKHLDEQPRVADGQSLLEGLETLQQETDYGWSRRSRALNYSADPQPWVADEQPEKFLDRLLKSPAKMLSLTEKGKIGFLEINGKGIELQGQSLDETRRAMLEKARVVMPDPDRVTGAEMSGFAIRMLYEPMIDLCDHLQTFWRPALAELVAKILSATRVEIKAGRSVFIGGSEALRTVPGAKASEEGFFAATHPWLPEDGALTWPFPLFVTEAFPVSVQWGPYFDLSAAEEGEVVQSTATAKAAGIASTQQAVERIAPIMGTTDALEEVRRIDSEQGFSGLVQ